MTEFYLYVCRGEVEGYVSRYSVVLAPEHCTDSRVRGSETGLGRLATKLACLGYTITYVPVTGVTNHA